MPEEMKPSSRQNAPDPSFNYERSHPERESFDGKLDQKPAPPSHQSDNPADAVFNQNRPQKDVTSGASDVAAKLPAPEQPDHSMKDEEPLGWDLAPQNISNPEHKRHPRTEGKGGTPDATDRRS